MIGENPVRAFIIIVAQKTYDSSFWIAKIIQTEISAFAGWLAQTSSSCRDAVPERNLAKAIAIDWHGPLRQHSISYGTDALSPTIAYAIESPQGASHRHRTRSDQSETLGRSHST